MPKTPGIPRLTLHKSSGQARIRFQGRDMYLGRYGDPKTNERYARLIAEIAAQKQRIQQTAPASSEFGKTTDLTIGELILAYLNFAENYYGKDSREPLGLKLALRSVNTLYGSALANDFGPKSLKAILCIE